MFGRRELRQLRVVRKCSQILLEHIWQLSETDRAGALIIATATLGVIGVTHGHILIDQPDRAAPKTRSAILRDLADAVENLAPIMESAKAEDVTPLLRHLAAMELVILSLGYPDDPTVGPVLRESWRRLKSAQPYASEGLAALRRHEDRTGVDALPRLDASKPLTDRQVMAALKFTPGYLLKRGDGRHRDQKT